MLTDTEDLPSLTQGVTVRLAHNVPEGFEAVARDLLTAVLCCHETLAECVEKQLMVDCSYSDDEGRSEGKGLDHEAARDSILPICQLLTAVALATLERWLNHNNLPLPRVVSLPL